MSDLQSSSVPQRLRCASRLMLRGLLGGIAVCAVWVHFSAEQLLADNPVSGVNDRAAAPQSPSHDEPSAADNSSLRSPPGEIPKDSNESIDQLLKQAERSRREQKFREAEILLTRAVQIDRNSVAAWKSLAELYCQWASDEVVQPDLLAAGTELENARKCVKTIVSISVDQGAPPINPEDVVKEEETLKKVETNVREACDARCKGWIVAANQKANDAYHSYWNVLALGVRKVKNERETVVKGLKELRHVFELGQWISPETRCEATDAMSELKRLVYPEEWNELLARAGFDPISRDTLKKWGLE